MIASDLGDLTLMCLCRLRLGLYTGLGVKADVRSGKPVGVVLSKSYCIWLSWKAWITHQVM